jgi:hypothetical protein
LPGDGQRSNGPIGLVSHSGTSWHLPKWAVEYPFNFRISGNGEQVFGRTEVYPGAAVAISVIPPMPTE